MFKGFLELSGWEFLIVMMVFTHITIASVTIYLHRAMAHRALELSPLPAHFFRFWLWLTTGMNTKEWMAVHRKHHARCETEEDPHSPQTHGLFKVLFSGVWLYVLATRNQEDMVKFGHGSPDDWIERHIYTPHGRMGLWLLFLISFVLFGLVPAVALVLISIGWIPFWAAGVINGVGHFFGYRNFSTSDVSNNIFPWGIFIGGEELHNNHHAYPTSAKLSSRWYELDIGWFYIRCLEVLKLAKVRRVAGKPGIDNAKQEADQKTLEVILAHRPEVLANYAKVWREVWNTERFHLPAGWHFSKLKKVNPERLSAQQEIHLAQVLIKSPALAKVHMLRQELDTLWHRSSESSEELLQKLKTWCAKAELSGIPALESFSLRIIQYA